MVGRRVVTAPVAGGSAGASKRRGDLDRGAPIDVEGRPADDLVPDDRFEG